MNKPRHYSLILGSAIFWMTAVVAIYYWIHKPLTPELARSLGGALADLLSAAIITAVAGGLGRRMLSVLLPNAELSRAERLSAEALLGLGVVGLLMFAVGLLWLHILSIGLLLIVLAALTFSSLRGWLRDFSGWIRGVSGSRALNAFIGLNLLMALGMALAPPVEFDALTYHLVGAKLWLADGKFHSLPGSLFFGFPQLMNTLYAGQMALLSGRITGAAVLHWMVGGLLLMGVGGYGARRFGAGIGLMAAAILLTATSIWLQFSWAYVDLMTAAYGMMTLIALDQWRHAQTDRTRWVILAGVFVGLAMSTKYNAAMLGIVAGIFILMYGRRGWLRDGFVFGIVAALVLLPWLLRNLAFYHNPLYPFGPLSGEFDALSREWYTNAARAPLRESPAFVAPIFLAPTFLGIEGAEIFSATIGPLFLLLIPMLFITWKGLDAGWRRALAGMLVMIVPLHVLWLITAYLSVLGAQIRFVFPMFGWLAVMAAVALESLRTLPKKPLDFAWIMRAMVGLVLVFTLVDHFSGTRPQEGDEGLRGTTLTSHFAETRAIEYLIGILDQNAYLAHRLGQYQVAMSRLNELPDDSHVLFLWETRSLYCEEPRITCDEDAVLMRWWRDRRRFGDGSAEAILENWAKDGATHLLVWEKGRDFEFENNAFFDENDFSEWQHLTGQLAVEWRIEDVYTLYRMPR